MRYLISETPANMTSENKTKLKKKEQELMRNIAIDLKLLTSIIKKEQTNSTKFHLDVVQVNDETGERQSMVLETQDEGEESIKSLIRARDLQRLKDKQALQLLET